MQALRDAAGGDLKQAASEADLAQKLNPLSVEPLFTEVAIARLRGQDAEAASLLGEATRLQPDNFETWQRLSQFEFLQGDDRRGGARRCAAKPTTTLSSSSPGPTPATCSTRCGCRRSDPDRLRDPAALGPAG